MFCYFIVLRRLPSNLLFYHSLFYFWVLLMLSATSCSYLICYDQVKFNSKLDDVKVLPL